jgi:hypothetical protein
MPSGGNQAVGSERGLDSLFTPKLPRAADPLLQSALNAFLDQNKQLFKKAHLVYGRRRYLASVLFVPWLLSCVSDRLALDLFAVCYALGLRDKEARKKYARTRSLLDAYWRGGWLTKNTVLSGKIIFRAILEVRPPPSTQKKPKRDREDIAGLGKKNQDDCEIVVPKKWSHFTKNRRALYSFSNLPAESASNLLPLGLAGVALQENAELRDMVNMDSKTILNGKNCIKDLLDRYFFLPEADERRLNISEGKTTIHLAAFGLFQYADWSRKRSKTTRIARKS